MTSPAPGGELLDDLHADPALVAGSLGHIARANRWFGGRAALRFGLARALEGRPPGPVTLLDIGTGLGDLPRDLARWAGGRGWALQPLGLERHPVAAHLASAAGVPTAVACGRTLPVRDSGVDLVTVSQVAHHGTEDEAIALFREASRVARVAVVVADLYRSRTARAAFRVGATALRFDRVTRADGLTSIARGYRPGELDALCRRAGVRARVWARPFFRVVAVWPTEVA